MHSVGRPWRYPDVANRKIHDPTFLEVGRILPFAFMASILLLTIRGIERRDEIFDAYVSVGQTAKIPNRGFIRCCKFSECRQPECDILFEFIVSQLFSAGNAIVVHPGMTIRAQDDQV